MASSSPSNRVDEFRKRFRRSGSLGIPFVPDVEIPQIKEFWQGGDAVGQATVTVLVKTSRSMAQLIRALESIEGPVNVEHIESREPRGDGDGDGGEMEVLLQLRLGNGLTADGVVEQMKALDVRVAEVVCTAPLITGDVADDAFFEPGDKDALSGVHWFPRTAADLDICAKRVLMYGTDLDADHPGFTDEVYRKRRLFFADIAMSYKHGQIIPRVEYTEEETQTWRTVYKELRVLHLKYACREYLENFWLLEKYCGYSEDKIPQLEDVTQFLKAKTGFRVRPVAGYLSSRDFLAGLAFRVFHCTQYIRHPSDPFYSPEPDCCHELLGHMALFADPEFAQFSQEIGLASLGSDDADLQRLANLYFFSIEFGLCRQHGQLKVYGAGLLSSIGELKHATEEDAVILPFDPDRVVKQECLITTYQAAYFYTENFEEAQQKLRMFTNTISRPFVVRYNPYTEAVEILNNKRSLTLAVNSLRSDINLLASALHYIF